MGEELFLNPSDPGRNLALPAEERKSRPAEAKSAAPEESKPRATPKAVENDQKTAWQTSPEVSGIIKSLTGSNTDLSIEMDRETQTIVVKVLDSATGEVIRRMPLRDPISHEDLRELKGLLLDVMD